MRKTENIINRTGINKTECKKNGHRKENKIPGVKCTPKIELYLSNFKGALHWWNGSLFFLIIILGITLGIFAGCKNIFVPEPPATPEAAGPGGGITVSLRLFTGSARSVMPGMKALTWEITASQGDITISVAEGEYPKFSLSLPVSGTWTFTVRGINSANDEIFTGSAEQNIESGSTTSISIPLSSGSGMTDSGVKEKLNLTIKPENVCVMLLSYRIDNGAWSHLSLRSEASMGGGGTIYYPYEISEGLSVGQHTLDLYFDGGSGFYFCTVAVNIWPGMTSDQWIKTNGEKYINDIGDFVITKEMVNEFVKTMGSVVFVNESVGENTPGTGSIYAPVNSVSKAVDILRKVNPEGKCNGTIMVSGETTIEDEIDVNSDESLTIKGMRADASITNNAGRVFNITGGSLTLEENITLTGTVTDGNGGAVYVNGGNFIMKAGSKITESSASYGGGVYVDSKGTFTMGGGTISKNRASGTGASGGGVCVYKGDFTMRDGSISGNKATESGGGVFVQDGTFTMEGGTIGGAIPNTADQNGGGVYVDGGSSSFTMTGGTIGGTKPNTAGLGGGVYVGTGNFTLGTLETPSSPVISGNTKTDNYPNNVYLDGTKVITIAGTLNKTQDSGNIGITMATPGEEFTLGWDSSGSTEPTFFFSDDTKRTVALSGSELSLNLVRVDGGICTLNEQNVTLSSFWISPYEVTQAEFESIMEENSNGIKANPSEFQGDTKPPAEGDVQGRRPVEKVSWYDAIVYCNLLSMKEGLIPCYTIKSSTDPAAWGTSPTSDSAEDYADWKSVTCDFNANGYRLPTEAEWEYAARGGQAGITDKSWDNTYSGSDTINDVAWYWDNSDSKTHEVGKKQANALGLYDMSGNVWEWCWDWHGSYPSDTEDPAGPDTGDSRVLRGGSWNGNGSNCTASSQSYFSPCGQSSGCGFRLVRSAR